MLEKKVAVIQLEDSLSLKEFRLLDLWSIENLGPPSSWRNFKVQGENF